MNLIALFAAAIGLIYIFLIVIGLVKSETLAFKRIITLSSLSMVLMLTFYLMGGFFSVWNYISIPAIFIMINIGIMVLTGIFNQLLIRFGQGWLKIIYYIGLMSTVFVSVLFVSEVGPHGGWHISNLLSGIVIVCSLILFCTAPFALVAKLTEVVRRNHRYMNNGNSVRDHQKVKTQKDKMTYYRDKGLNDQEIIYLRQELAIAKDRILAIEKTMNANAKLRSIENRHNLIEVSKQFFKDIVSEPKRFNQAGIFLNKLLPSVEDLAAKYLEMSNHVAKTKQTYMILDKSALTIDQLAQTVVEQYLSFHQTAFDELDDEIRLAQKNLAKVQRKNAEAIKEDLVDDLVSDPFDTLED